MKLILDGKYAIFNGKKMLIKDYFAVLALSMPKTYNEETGEYLEHYAELRKAYKTNGIQGYNDYVAMIYKVKDKEIKRKMSWYQKIIFNIKTRLIKKLVYKYRKSTIK